MKRLKEETLRKESSIRKVQFDREWFYAVKDMEDYLNEDLTGIETIKLKVSNEAGSWMMPCATLEDIQRVLKKELLDDFTGSVSRKRR